MYNLIISLLLSIVVTVVMTVAAKINIIYAGMVSSLVFIGAYILLMRITMKKLTALMETAQRDIQAGRTEKAVKVLEGGFKFAPWQFYIKGQLNAQIGMILFLKRDFGAAFDYLKKGFVRQWVAMGMLGVCYMKRNKSAKMIETFDKATTASKKEPLIWNVYAYCLEKIGEKEKAVAVLEKGVKKTGGDERLQGNLEALREGKKMKMKGYGEMWYQFHLEKQGAVIKQQTKAMQGRRKVVRR